MTPAALILLSAGAATGFCALWLRELRLRLDREARIDVLTRADRRLPRPHPLRDPWSLGE